ncbi:MAG: FtsX-like permease family protein [Spirochaetes bacterium]|nr:FtsX-like permease family protein [Spirochaetota bacterium]
MRILSMALRNLGRNRRRTILAAVSVFLAVMMNMVLSGFMGAFLDSLVKNYTKNETGHVNVTTAGYRARERFMPLSEAIPDSGKVIEAIRSAPGLGTKVRLAAARINFGVVLSSGANSKTAMAIAGDPEIEKSLLMFDHSVKEGSYLSKPGDAILGKELALTLGLGVGDVLKVVTQKADYGLGMKRFTISGLFFTGVNDMDESVFMVGIEDARELLGLPGGATHVIVMLDDYRKSREASGAIASALASAGIAGMSTVPWLDIGQYGQLVALAGGMYFWMYVIFTFLGAFIIANIMMMIVLERRKEIGILKSMGMPRHDILGLFMSEGCMLGAIGAAAGAMAGLGINFVLSKTGLDLTSAMQSIDYPMDNVLYPRPDALMALVLFGLGTLVAAVLSFLPSRKAATMNSVDAIKSI